MESKKIVFLFCMLLSMLGIKAFADNIVYTKYDFFLANADGVPIYYKYINNATELEVAPQADFTNLEILYSPKPNKDAYSGNVVIPEEVTYMNVTRKVTSIGHRAFYNCSGLTSVTISNNVISIGSEAFKGCISLTSVMIPNSVTDMGGGTFYGCNGLTSVTIGNSVTDIGYQVFYGCSSLTSITIPSSVWHIRDSAFGECNNIQEVISKIENPFDIDAKSFSENTFTNARLYVPEGTIDIYKNRLGWKKFAYIEEGAPSGVEQVLSIAKLTQSDGGMLIVQGIKNDILVNVYNANGSLVGSAISQNGQATINTNLQPGSVAIVRLGEETVKVIIK